MSADEQAENFLKWVGNNEPTQSRPPVGQQIHNTTILFTESAEEQSLIQHPNPKPLLIDRFGPPVFLNATGQISSLNELFWAGDFKDQQIEILYEPYEEMFYSYDEGTGLYLNISENRIRKSIAEQILEASRQWPAYEGLSRFRNERHLRGIITHLKGLAEQSNAFVSNVQIVHLQNCVLQLEEDGTFTTTPFSPEFRSRSRSPIAYDPAATCHQFEDSLLSHLAPDDRELLQKYAGQCLLGRNLTQRILILDGVAGASKGAFVLVVRGVVGPSNTYELRTQLLDGRFEIGRMAGKTLLLGGDVKANFLSTPAASRLKSLVGGDTLEAERKTSNKDQSIAGNFNVMITSNSRLTVRLEGDQGAWERRLALVSYDTPHFGKTIPEIHEKLLKEEGPGILNWCLTGLEKLFQEIRGETGTLVLSQRQRERVHGLLSESDGLRIYIRGNIVKTSSDDNLTGAEIIEAYTSYSIDCGWTPIPSTIAHRRLDDLMLELFSTARANNIQRDGKAHRGFRHVRFRGNDETDPKV
jgi:hypothetical protein